MTTVWRVPPCETRVRATVVAFRGVFLTSGNPTSTANFNDEVAELALEEVQMGVYNYWRVDCDGVRMAIHDAARGVGY